MRVTLQPSFVLHTRPFNETSVIADVFTQSCGRVPLLAKGVRTMHAKYRGLLRPFLPLLVSWSGKTELMSLSHIELAGTPLNLVGNALLSGLYINELLVKLLPRFDAYPDIFSAYQNTLAAWLNQQNQAEVSLSQDAFHERSLRLLEKIILMELGYGFSLDKESATGQAILPDQYYIFMPGKGLSRCRVDDADSSVFKGKSLLSLHQDALFEAEDLQSAKRLHRQALGALLGHKPLRSRDFFKKLAGMQKLKKEVV